MSTLLSYWPLVSVYGFWALPLAGALLVAWFVPPFRTPALITAASIVVGLICFQTGDNIGAERIQKQWDAAVVRTIEKSETARGDAERDLAAEPDDLSLRNDPDNRNRP